MFHAITLLPSPALLPLASLLSLGISVGATPADPASAPAAAAPPLSLASDSGDGGCTSDNTGTDPGSEVTENWYRHFCGPGWDPAVTAPCGVHGNGIEFHGCRSSANIHGARLTIDSGDAAQDDVVLIAYDERPGTLSIFLQGPSRAPAGILFGDGVRCVSGSLKRLYSRTAPGGVITAPQPGEPSIRTRSAALGDPIPSPATRYYQVWYRDGPGHFNITSAVQIDWP